MSNCEYKVGDRVRIREDVELYRDNWNSYDETDLNRDRTVTVTGIRPNGRIIFYSRNSGQHMYFNVTAIKEKVMDVIERLKKNEKPFGLMDKDMQEKAKSLRWWRRQTPFWSRSYDLQTSHAENLLASS